MLKLTEKLMVISKEVKSCGILKYYMDLNTCLTSLETKKK